MDTPSVSPQERKIVLENFLSLSTLQSLNYLLPIIVLPYLIRVLGAEKFGLIAFAQAFIQYFIILTDYGFGFSATRRISLCNKERLELCNIFSSVITVKIFLTLASLLILSAIISLVPRFSRDWPLYYLSFGAVIGNTLFPSWFFQGTEKMKYIPAIHGVCGIGYVFALIFFVRDPNHYLFVPLLTSLYFLSTGVAGLYIAFHKFKIEFILLTYSDIKEELKRSWSYFTSVVAINAYTATRIFAVGLLTNHAITGYYAAAEKIAGFIQGFPLDSFTQALYPRLTFIFNNNKTRALEIMRKAQKSTTYAYLLILPVIWIFAPHIVTLMCSRAFIETVVTLRVLLLGVFCVCVNAFKVQFLLVCGKTRMYARLHIIAALIGLPLIFISIHFLSYKGAALSTLLIEGSILLATIGLLKKATSF